MDSLKSWAMRVFKMSALAKINLVCILAIILLLVFKSLHKFVGRYTMKNEETPDEIECTVCKTIFYTEEEITKH